MNSWNLVWYLYECVHIIQKLMTVHWDITLWFLFMQISSIYLYRSYNIVYLNFLGTFIQNVILGVKICECDKQVSIL